MTDYGLSDTVLSGLEQNAENVTRTLLEGYNPEVAGFVNKYVDLDDDECKVLSTSTILNIQSLSKNSISSVINLKRVNDIRFVNKFFEAVNSKLPHNGVFIGCLETKEDRRVRILNKYAKIFSYPYYAADFTVKRLCPKLPFTKGLYFLVTRGHNRVISLPETLGRLVSCGFTIMETKKVGYLTYFAAKKTALPQFDMAPTYGALVKLRRIGKNGKMINVYKMRTMHPYSEYIQDYIFENNNLQNGGKIKDDYRITGWGKVFRKLWIDELPMIYNFIKGDLKIFGVRPLSVHYFNLYPDHVKELRVKSKPGLIPPFYADLPQTFDEIVESERRYLMAYSEKPIRTDIKYFFKAAYNIIFKSARSN